MGLHAIHIDLILANTDAMIRQCVACKQYTWEVSVTLHLRRTLTGKDFLVETSMKKEKFHHPSVDSLPLMPKCR